MGKTHVRELPVARVESCAPMVDPNVTAQQANTLAAIFKALADPTRVQIVNLLANAAAPVCVCDLTPRLGLSQGTVSFHLKKLLDIGFVEREQRGTWAYYSLNREGLERLAEVFTI
jgi:ArsR family transcriptional regulator, arsenate/arsenite/antimonite-responsive transcriptional repressor